MTITEWRALVYGEGHRGPQREKAEAALRDNPQFGVEDPHAAGRADAIVDGAAASSGKPALAAVTHSGLCRVRPADFEACVRKLIALGADVNAGLALYGAVGKNNQPAIARLLLDAGADPNDNESVYHATESRDLICLRMLLESGARAKGTNALNHSLDYNDVVCTRLLLDAGADPNEGTPALFWAIRRRRSLAHVEALLAAGADPRGGVHGLTPYRAALLYGLTDVAAKLQALTGESPNAEDSFVAACARNDRDEALRLNHDRTFLEMPEPMLRLLPESVESGNIAAAKLMVELGWPITARGGDWQATALNLAVFRGDAGLTRFLLRHGATWLETHGHGDNVVGTLSYASVERPAAWGDWLGCAKAMVEEAGMPKPSADRRFSGEVEAYFASL